jgi:hypothetical protein
MFYTNLTWWHLFVASGNDPRRADIYLPALSAAYLVLYTVAEASKYNSQNHLDEISKDPNAV